MIRWNRWMTGLWLVLLAAPVQAEGPDPGARAWLQCRACHSLNAGEPDKVGPNLHGLFGSKAASRRADYAYSPALKASGLVWDAATLDRWIENPVNVVPGTRMVFGGLPDPERRRALIAFLESSTRRE